MLVKLYICGLLVPDNRIYIPQLKMSVCWCCSYQTSFYDFQMFLVMNAFIDILCYFKSSIIPLFNKQICSSMTYAKILVKLLLYFFTLDYLFMLLIYDSYIYMLLCKQFIGESSYTSIDHYKKCVLSFNRYMIINTFHDD